MDPVILGILSGVCKEDLQMFERVRAVIAQNSTDCYMCIGKHNLFFVSKEMDMLVEPNQLSYLDVKKALTDTSTLRFFMLTLENNDNQQILIESHHRETVLERIGLCWQAEFMFKKFSVEKFPQAKVGLGEKPDIALPGMSKFNKHNIDNLQVRPYKGYEEDPTFKHRGYSFFLRSGFRSSSGLKQGSFVHDTGWTEEYNAQKVQVHPGVQITIHVHDPIPAMELEKSATGADDIRTVATEYKQALTETLSQFYVLVNCSYQKKMNRTNDVASWDGWEFFVRSKEHVFVCILLRREYIPPLCDIVQDIAILLRCPNASQIRQDGCEVLLDECRFVADSLASTSEVGRDSACYRDIIEARLDTLQFNEEGYRWLEGNMKLVPVHRKPAAIKFVKSIVKILDNEALGFFDSALINDEVFKDIPVLHNPLLVPQEMLSDAESLLGQKSDRDSRRNAWFWRIARYLAYCVDGGLLGDRFSMQKLVSAVGKGTEGDNVKLLKSVVEFLLHVTPVNNWTRAFSGARMPLSQLLQEPSSFSQYTFNERVMRVLLTEDYIKNEWGRKKASGAGYEKLLATMIVSENVGIGLRTLICRQILENTSNNDGKKDDNDAKSQVLVPALVQVMKGKNMSLTSCATAALVNLSFSDPNTKILLVQHGAIKLSVQQLKQKDDDLTLYTLYLMVNLTKTPHHRAIVVREGGVPLLVDTLTSSYQNLRKQKILTEVASVLGQLCNDRDTRNLISEDFPVVLCFLWVYDAAPPNSKLKSKLLFALRQLCVLAQNKIKVGQHVIPTVIEELGHATWKFEECATNAILLLTMLANIHANANMMHEDEKLEAALKQCGLQTHSPALGAYVFNEKTKFHRGLWEKTLTLKERVKESVIASSGN